MPIRPPVRLLSRPVDNVAIRLVTAMLIPLLGLLSGCGGPCADLSERVCASAGESSAACTSLRATNTSPHAGDREACAAGVAYLDELKRGR